MKKYLYLAKSSFQTWLAYRVGFIFTILSTIIYIFITYYLWQAIYSEPGRVLNGMTFNQTFLYLALASAVVSVLQTNIEWSIGNDIISGSIIMGLIKPVNYQILILSRSFGSMLCRLVFISIPSLLLIIIAFDANITIGINILFFLITIFLSFLVNYSFEFIVGVLSFYTQSIWGIFFTKSVIVALLSGATIPISFFPDTFQRILTFLPFQAIYNIPLKILTSQTLNIGEYAEMVLVQIFWIIGLFIAGRLFYNKSLKILTVNGG